MEEKTERKNKLRRKHIMVEGVFFMQGDVGKVSAD